MNSEVKIKQKLKDLKELHDTYLPNRSREAKYIREDLRKEMFNLTASLIKCLNIKES